MVRKTVKKPLPKKKPKGVKRMSVFPKRKSEPQEPPTKPEKAAEAAPHCQAPDCNQPLAPGQNAVCAAHIRR